ncbi:MAG: ATP-binding protein [Pseudomonadota bacterium]
MSDDDILETLAWREVTPARWLQVLCGLVGVALIIILFVRVMEYRTSPANDLRVVALLVVDAEGERVRAPLVGHAYRDPTGIGGVRIYELPLPERVTAAKAFQGVYVRAIVRKAEISLVRGGDVIWTLPASPNLYRQFDPVFFDLSGAGGLSGGDTLRLTVDGQNARARVRTIFIGDRADVESKFRWTRFLSIHLPMAALACATLAALLILAFVRIPARQGFLFSFSALMVCWVVRNLLFIGPLALLPPGAYWPVYMASTLGVLITSVFLVNYWTFNLPVVTRWIAPGLALVGSLISGATLLPVEGRIDMVLAVGNVIGLTAFAMLFGMLVTWLVVAKKPMWFETLVFLGCILLGMIDLIGDALPGFAALIAPGTALNSFYGPIVPIPLAIALVATVSRFSAATRQTLKNVNTDLALQLAAREDTLNALYKEREAEVLEATLLRERQRLMQDMHDGFGGDLLALALRAEAGRVDQTDMAGELRTALQNLRLFVDAVDTVDGDLTSALGILRGRIEPQLRDAKIVLNWEPLETQNPVLLGPGGTLSLYHMIQEAVRNVIQHSRANVMQVSFRLEGDLLSVRISDNGLGLPSPRKDGRGLNNIRQRAARLGGDFELESSRYGTLLRIRLPIREPDSDPQHSG